MKVWIYVNTSKPVGDPDHLRAFETEEDADAWFRENDAEGVAFEYPIRRSTVVPPARL